MFTVELIDAKQPLAGDLCPLCPPAHYLVTNMAEGGLKPLTVPPDEMAVDDETALCHRLESCWPDVDDVPLLVQSAMTSFRDEITAEEDSCQTKAQKDQTAAGGNSNLTSLL